MNRSVGLVILQISVALFLLVSGVTGLLHTSAGDLAAVVTFLNKMFENQSVVTLVIIVLSVCELIAGVFLFSELFTKDLRITDIILFVFVILWVANIILVDFVGPISAGISFKSLSGVLSYLSTLASHLMVLGALIMVTKKFN
jgi:uncharacterized membrane protein YphA (DoxX/SURF4 family)